MQAGERTRRDDRPRPSLWWATRAKVHTKPVSGALIEDLDGNHCAVSDCLDAGEMAAAFVLTPPVDQAVDGVLRVDVWLCYYHARMLRSGVADMRFEPPRAASPLKMLMAFRPDALP